ARYSMVSMGAVVVESGLKNTFYAQLKPISDEWVPESLAIAGFTRADTLAFEAPQVVMERFAAWLAESSQGSPRFISDNNGFDWQFINWYFHRFTGANPFGHSSSNLGSLYRGLQKDMSASFKHLRRTAHTHNPVDDVIGNAEALLSMQRDYGLKIQL
ncbi:MAG TPA: hypothetical protein VGJ22_06410, partial [Anaerolineales bacterium]